MAPRRLGSERKKVAGLKLTRPIAIIDLETTGTSVDGDRIVEIGILKVMPDGAFLRFTQRLKPGIKIPKEATRVHGITNDDVAGKPTFKAVARRIKKFIHRCDMAGFNLKSFDLPILEAEFKRAGMSFSYGELHVIDVKEIYHVHETRTLKDAVRFYCDSMHDEAHSALEDARATWQVLEAQIKKYGLPQSVNMLEDFLRHAHSSNYMDSGRWFTRRDGAPILAKGQYRGVALSKIAKRDSEYLEWVLGLGDVPADTKKIIREKLSH